VRKDLEARNYSRPVSTSNGGVFGVDVSQWAGQSTWGCMKTQGEGFAIVREYQETCNVDPNGVHTVANAWAAGIAHVDIYLYPSFTCGYSGAQQVDQTIDSVSSQNMTRVSFYDLIG
jgi:GH25 family lysozyme M1 (1,4-beta-N-acetylmuramidase)